MAKRARRNQTDDVEVVGAESHPLRDIYFQTLTMPWWKMLIALGLVFLLLNAIFATAYVITGGIEGAHPGSFADAFFFSAQTLGTIGYGAMHPTTFAANVVAVVESLASVLFIALATGLVFTRFSRSTETMVFSDFVCIGLMDGQPTLTLRVGNDREGAIMDARVHVTVFRTHRTAEGVTMYRMKALQLAREHTPALGRTFTVIHTIDEASPLHGLTPEDCEKDEIELLVNIVGTDETLLQPIYGRVRYLPRDLKWGARLGDVLEELPNGNLRLDVRKFDDIVLGEPTEAFPYPRR